VGRSNLQLQTIRVATMSLDSWDTISRLGNIKQNKAEACFFLPVEGSSSLYARLHPRIGGGAPSIGSHETKAEKP
jgi:hypothetical protein